MSSRGAVARDGGAGGDWRDDSNAGPSASPGLAGGHDSVQRILTHPIQDDCIVGMDFLAGNKTVLDLPCEEAKFSWPLQSHPA